LRIGNAVGAAMSNQRVLGPAEAGVMALVGSVLLLLLAVGLLWPMVVVAPLSLLFLWIAVSLLVRAYLLRRRGYHEADRQADRPGPGNEP
jgi:cardiolipin synthase